MIERKPAPRDLPARGMADREADSSGLMVGGQPQPNAETEAMGIPQIPPPPETLQQRRLRLGSCAVGFIGGLARRRAGIGERKR